jgi:hypothetical protein
MSLDLEEDRPLSRIEVAHVLAKSVERYVKLGVDRRVATRLVALDNGVTGNCVSAAVKIVAREAGA